MLPVSMGTQSTVLVCTQVNVDGLQRAPVMTDMQSTTPVHANTRAHDYPKKTNVEIALYCFRLFQNTNSEKRTNVTICRQYIYGRQFRSHVKDLKTYNE